MKKNETTIYPNNFKHNTTLLLISSRIRAKFLLFLQEKHKQTDVYKEIASFRFQINKLYSYNLFFYPSVHS